MNNFTDTFIMHRLSITVYIYTSAHVSCTWRDIAALSFANSIAFKGIFTVKGPLVSGNDGIGSYYYLKFTLDLTIFSLNHVREL